MKSNYSKPTLFAIIVCFGVFVAISAYAYTPPAVSAPGENNEITALDTSVIDQVKAGDLGVGTFYAGKMGGGSLFDQQTMFNGVIRGGSPADKSSTVSVGNGAEVNGTLKANGYFNSSVLKHGGAAEAPLCADQSGVIILCP